MRRYVFISALLLASAAALFASDTLVFRDGTRLEGKVLREDAKNYIFEVQVTKTIREEKAIPKADVLRVDRETPDIGAFRAIEKLYPAPDLLSADEYGVRIRAVEKFLADYKVSAKRTQAEKMLTQLKREANEVLAGGIKLSGKMISPAEYRSNAYEIDARVQAVKIRKLAQEGRYLAALRAFSEFSRDFPNTEPHVELVPLITQVINRHLAEASQLLSSYEARQRERQVGLDRMASADRQATEAAIREELAFSESRLKREKEAKVGWVTLDPYFKPSLDDTITFGKMELSRLSSMGAPLKVDGGKAYRDALSLIQGRGEKEAVETAISQARAALVAQRYLDALQAAASR